MAHELTIVAIAGAEGTGRTTLARMLAGRHDGTYYSVHSYLSVLFRIKYGRMPDERSELTTFADALRKKTRNPAVAIKEIVKEIFSKRKPHLHVLESIYCPGEIDFLQAQCKNKANLILIGLDSYPEERIARMGRNQNFKKNPDNAAILVTQEWSDLLYKGPLEANTVGCLEKIPEEFIFFNEDGHLEEVYLEIKSLLKW